MLNPTFPNVSALDVASVTPVNRYLLDPGLAHPRLTRASAGVDYAFTQRLHAIATYRYTRSNGLLRGLNLNAPTDGVRPDSQFGNVIEAVSDGRGRQHQLQLFAQTPPPPPPGLNGGGPRWDWKRWGFFSGYTLLSDTNDTDGAFSAPATGRLQDDWGPSPNTARHRLIAGFTSAALRNLSWQIDGQFSTGTPYTILTGADDNGDLIFNDRPTGVGRNSVRGAAQFSLNLFSTYGWTFGPRQVLPGGPIIYGTPAGVNVTSFAPPPTGKYRLSIIVAVQNLTNHANYMGYSGVLASPLFGTPTIASQPRRVNVGMQLGF